jgi:TP901 family phage tail tape measure protein
MLNALGLGWVFEAKDEASHVVHHLNEGLHELHHTAEHGGLSIGKALGMASTAIAAAGAAAVAAAGGAFALAEHAEGFSSAIRAAGVASHATAEQMHELEEIAKNSGLDSLRGNATTAAETLAELAKEGYDAQDAGQALNGTLALMKISMGALSSRNAAGLVNDTLGQFGMNAGQATELADKLAFAMRNFGFRAEELTGTMSGLASGAQLVGASLDDTLIGVGLIKSVLPSATKSAAAMNAAMQQLASTRAQKELGLIGVRVTDTTGKIRPLVEIMGSLAERTEHMTQAQIAHKLESIAGGKAAGGLSAIIDGLRKGVKDSEGNILTGAAAIAHLRGEMANTNGTASKMSALLGDDMGGALKSLGSAMSNLGVVIGEGLESPFKSAFQTANLFIRGITQLFSQGGFSGEVKDALDKNLGIKNFAIGVFMWIERIKNYFRSWADGFKAAFAPFAPVLDQLMVAFRQLGQALGIVDQTASDNASVWDSLAEYGRSAGEIFGTLAGAVLPVLVGAVQLVTGAVQAMREIWKSIGPAIMGVYQVLKGVFELVGGLLTGDWKMMWDGFVDVVTGALRAVLKITMGAFGVLADIFDSLGSSFGANLGLRKQLDEFHALSDASLTVLQVKAKSLVEPTAQPAATAVAQAARVDNSIGRSGALAGAIGGQVVHLVAPVHLDGVKIGEAMATAKRDDRSRSFEPVRSAGGGF